MIKRHVRALALFPAALTLAGCASDIMRGYLGRGPEAVMARYGPPDSVFDMPDGRRAYQWVQISQSTSPGSEESRTRWVKRRGDGPPERVTVTKVTPPTSAERRCFYTLYAHREGGGWVFDDFARPEFGC